MRQGELGWAHRAPPRSPPGSAGARRVFLPLPRLDFCLVQGPISAVPLAWVPEPHAVCSALTPPCVADTHLSQAKSLASTTRVCSSKEKKKRYYQHVQQPQRFFSFSTTLPSSPAPQKTRSWFGDGTGALPEVASTQPSRRGGPKRSPRLGTGRACK